MSGHTYSDQKMLISGVDSCWYVGFLAHSSYQWSCQAHFNGYLQTGGSNSRLSPTDGACLSATWHLTQVQRNTQKLTTTIYHWFSPLIWNAIQSNYKYSPIKHGIAYLMVMLSQENSFCIAGPLWENLSWTSGVLSQRASICGALMIFCCSPDQVVRIKLLPVI